MHVGDALVVEQPAIRAVLRAQRGGKFTRGAVMRYGDWLPLKMLIESLPGLEERDELYTTAIYPALESLEPAAKASLNAADCLSDGSPKQSSPEEGAA